MGKKRVICGINHCSRNKGHTGPHSWSEEWKNRDKAAADPSTHMRFGGEILALKKIQKDDPQLGTVLLDSYLRNRPGHKQAKARLRQIEEQRAKEELGVY